MVVCNNCQHKNPPGSIFCDECGAQLVASEFTTQSIRTDQVKDVLRQDTGGVQAPSVLSTNTWGSLHLMESGQILPLTDRNEYTLGRISDAQPVMPDVDLSSYHAYANGVSRLHALLRRDGKRVVVMDLGSANGTYVNGKRLSPNAEHLLNHGDVIALGKLKLQILLK